MSLQINFLTNNLNLLIKCQAIVKKKSQGDAVKLLAVVNQFTITANTAKMTKDK